MGGIERFFLSSTNLPAMPDLARLVVASFEDPAVDAAALARISRTDPEACLRVAGATGSADIDAAASRLGLASLRDHLLLACLATVFPPVDVLDPLRFWEHAWSTASFARCLSRVHGVDEDSAFFAGLIARAGQLQLARTLPALVADVERSLTRPGERASAEIRILGYPHAQISAELATRWRLPRRIIEGLSASADPLAAHPFSPLGALLDLAGTLADAVQLGLEPSPAAAQARPGLVARLRVDTPWLQSHCPGAMSPPASLALLVLP